MWLEKYGPPTRTDYRVTVENLSSKVSWDMLPVFLGHYVNVIWTGELAGLEGLHEDGGRGDLFGKMSLKENECKQPNMF